MATSITDSSIRGISLLRRLGSIFVVSTIFLLLTSSIYHTIGDKIWLSDLKEILENGISQRADVEEEVQVQYINGIRQMTLKYSFTEGDRKYNDEYKLFGTLPQSTEGSTKLLTVHYLKDDPSKSSLNIEDEIMRIEESIDDSSVFWFCTKIFLALIFAIFLLGQFLSLVSEIRNINKPIVIPDYLKSNAAKEKG